MLENLLFNLNNYISPIHVHSFFFPEVSAISHNVEYIMRFCLALQLTMSSQTQKTIASNFLARVIPYLALRHLSSSVSPGVRRSQLTYLSSIVEHKLIKNLPSERADLSLKSFIGGALSPTLSLAHLTRSDSVLFANLPACCKNTFSISLNDIISTESNHLEA